jgi:hypothetical protein
MGLIAADSFIFKQDNGKGPEKRTGQSKGRPHKFLFLFGVKNLRHPTMSKHELPF